MTGSYIRNLLVSGCGVSMDLRNQYDALDPDDPGYVSLSEVDPGSFLDQERCTLSRSTHMMPWTLLALLTILSAVLTTVLSLEIHRWQVPLIIDPISLWVIQE